VVSFCEHCYEPFSSHRSQGIPRLAERTISFSRKSLFHGVSVIIVISLQSLRPSCRLYYDLMPASLVASLDPRLLVGSGGFGILEQSILVSSVILHEFWD
jgi:hypothetical protein